MTDERGWASLEIVEDIMVPGVSVHIVPVVDRYTLTPANGHELHVLCWCHPRRFSTLLDDVLLLSHYEPSWPGANDDAPLLQ